MTRNAKIPEDVFHKLQIHPTRIEFECLCSHPFNFKIYGMFETFSAITAIPTTDFFSKWEFVLKSVLSVRVFPGSPNSHQ